MSRIQTFKTLNISISLICSRTCTFIILGLGHRFLSSLALEDVISSSLGGEFHLFFHEELEPYSCVDDLPIFVNCTSTFIVM